MRALARAEQGEGDAELRPLPRSERRDPRLEGVDESLAPSRRLEGVRDDAARGGGEGPALGGGERRRGRRRHAGKKARPVDGVHRGRAYFGR